MHIDGLPTPAALVDLDVVERNCAAMLGRAHALGVRLRPHVKTHKCVELARLQLGVGQAEAGPVTVSTLAEAVSFASAGFADILWAVVPPLERLDEVAGQVDAGVDLAVLVDGFEVARAVAAAGEASGVAISVYLEVDTGDGRTGVDPHHRSSLELARWLVETDWTVFRGVLTHGGQTYRGHTPGEVARMAGQERDRLVAFARLLEAEGIEVPERSLGSTPGMAHVDHLRGITEVRPGNYVFFDVFQTSLGSCRAEDVGFSVLGTVISRQPDRGQVVLNTGSLALSADPGPRHLGGPPAYGLVRELDGRPTAIPMRVAGLSQEHARLVADGPLPEGAFPVGSKLRILPNHSCLAAACHPRFVAVRGQETVAWWSPCRGW